MLANVFTKTTLDRWKGMTIGSLTIAALLIFGMAVYRDIDLEAYTGLPEAWRALMNIPEDADVASLAFGAIYSSYGALTLAALALAMGSASIAGEEQGGTMGLLLGNPKSRTYVLLSKAASLVLLTAGGAAIMWLGAVIAPVVLGVDVTGMTLGAFVFLMGINALFYGFLAMAVGAWTGSRGAASGVAAGVMVVSFFAFGLLPLVESLENAAKAFPWYYFMGSDPITNGVEWGHVGVLTAGCAVFVVAALVGVNRRDLKDKSTGVTLVDRLRANPRTKQVADRLAGGTRVSHIWIKTLTDHQGLIVIVGALMFFVMGLMIGPMYNLIDETLKDFADAFPETLLALFGGGDMGTPEGFYQVESFGMMAPIAVMVVTVAIAARSVAGEEANRTMGLLLANPISRTNVLMQTTVAMVIAGFVVGAATFAGVAGGSLLGALGIDIGNIAATSLLVTLVGVLFGALALALSAGTGRVKVAVFGTVGVALTTYVANAILQLNDSVAGYAKWSPFYYYLSSDPLNNGMHWGHAAVLVGLILLLVGAAVVLFRHRDLRQTG